MEGIVGTIAGILLIVAVYLMVTKPGVLDPTAGGRRRRLAPPARRGAARS